MDHVENARSTVPVLWSCSPEVGVCRAGWAGTGPFCAMLHQQESFAVKLFVGMLSLEPWTTRNMQGAVCSAVASIWQFEL